MSGVNLAWMYVCASCYFEGLYRGVGSCLVVSVPMFKSSNYCCLSAGSLVPTYVVVESALGTTRNEPGITIKLQLIAHAVTSYEGQSMAPKRRILLTRVRMRVLVQMGACERRLCTQSSMQVDATTYEGTSIEVLCGSETEGRVRVERNQVRTHIDPPYTLKN